MKRRWAAFQIEEVEKTILPCLLSLTSKRHQSLGPKPKRRTEQSAAGYSPVNSAQLRCPVLNRTQLPARRPAFG